MPSHLKYAFLEQDSKLLIVISTSFSNVQEEKCHFMVREGIVLGYKISPKRIEVDRTKVDIIEKLPPPNSVRAIRSFLGHARCYRRFI